MTAPWLSVLIPTYNGAAYLRAALDSVVAQQDPDIECLAIDDGSTDATVTILEEYRDRLNLEIEVRPRIGNWVANTNRALERARGTYACLLHQDDLWMPGRLTAVRAALERNPAVDLLVHPTWFIDPRGARLGTWRCPLPEAPQILNADTVLPRLLVQNFIAIPAPVFSVPAARSFGGLDEGLWYTADWDFWLKLAAAGRTLCLPDRLAGFRVHAEAQTARRSIDIADYRRQHELVLQRHLPALAIDHRRPVRRIAELSIAVNTALAGRYHGLRPGLGAVTAAALRAGPSGLWRYLRYSRIVERVRARLKVLKRGPVASPPVADDALAR